VAVLLIAIAASGIAVATRGRRSAPGIRPLPGNLVEAYESRLPEVERQFASQPRESVAAAKLLVDDMLNRMGYPVRMANEERVRDLKGRRRPIADLYKQASGLNSDPTTEQLRQSLQRYLEIARKLLDEAVHQAS
jgi:hypothetical protein